MRAELISIGDELLCGRTLNTHGRDLGLHLFNIGIALERDTTVGDQPDQICAAVDEALQRVPILFISGGLGPTTDDITLETLSTYFNQPIIEDQDTVHHLNNWYKKRGRILNAHGQKQANVLEHAHVIQNPVGAAPAQQLNLPHQQLCFLLPGPPKEFNALLTHSILPTLRTLYTQAKPKEVRTIHTKGIGESDLIATLEQGQFHLPSPITAGYYPGEGQVEIRLSADSDDKALLEKTHYELQQLFSEFLALVDAPDD